MYQRNPVAAAKLHAEAEELMNADARAALQLLEKAASLDPNNPEIYIKLGRLYDSELHEEDKALRAPAVTLLFHPHPTALLTLAIMHVRFL